MKEAAEAATRRGGSGVEPHKKNLSDDGEKRAEKSERRRLDRKSSKAQFPWKIQCNLLLLIGKLAFDHGGIFTVAN